jgi:hypothetical protein
VYSIIVANLSTVHPRPPTRVSSSRSIRFASADDRRPPLLNDVTLIHKHRRTSRNCPVAKQSELDRNPDIP